MNDDKTVIMAKAFRVAPGTRLNGIYEVESLIGSGGMSEIYKGRNIQTHDDVAIKVILPEYAQDEQMVALFRREALTLNRLSNEAIVRYHVFSHDPAVNLLYLAMEFIDGPTLRDSMKQRPLSQQEACLLISKVAAGMQVAHSEGVVHRDLSTDNIILAGNSVSKPKVIDFGIARSSAINDSTLLSSGFAGKYNFVSPEQLGLYGGKVQETSDIYSLGLVFAAALLGRPLDMAGSHADVVMKRQSVPDLAMINPGVRPLIESMLQPRPAMRPQSMTDIVEQLEKWLPARGENTLRGGRSVRAKPVPLAGTPATSAESKGGGGIVAFLLLAACAGALWYGIAQTEAGRELAGKVMDKVTALSGGAPVAEKGPLGSPVNPETGKSELKAGDPAPTPAANSIAAEQSPGAKTETETAAASKDSRDVKVEAANEEPSAPQVSAAPVEVPVEVETKPVQGTTPEASSKTDVADAAADPIPAEEAIAVPPRVIATSKSDSGPQIASKTPEQPEEESAPEESATGKLTPSEWVAQFDGGTCFHATGSNAGGVISIEGFGAQVEPFEKLDKSFKNAFGVEPQIRLRAVTSKQCPVVDFAHQTRSDMAFSLKSDFLKGGEPVDAKLSGVQAENVSIFVVTPDGIIVNVTALSSRFDDEIIVQIPNEALASKAGSDYLLLAVASDKALVALDKSNAPDSRKFLQELGSEGKGTPITTAVKYLRKK
jgi:eukaryotic-like serine/threonine-protein kinase